MPELNKGLAERVEVFSRATSDALQKAVGDVLDACNPWQLRRQQELLLIARRLGELLADDGPGGAPGAGHGKSQ